MDALKIFLRRFYLNYFIPVYINGKLRIIRWTKKIIELRNYIEKLKKTGFQDDIEESIVTILNLNTMEQREIVLGDLLYLDDWDVAELSFTKWQKRIK